MAHPLETRINNLEKKAKMLKKLQTIMNTIKANGLYSQKEQEADMQKMDKLNAPQEEINLICQCWYIRRVLNDNLMQETKKLLDKIKKDMKT